MKLAKSENKFQLAPEDTLQGVVVDVVDMGMLPGFNPEELVQKVKLVFQLEEETDDGVRFIVQSFPLNASINSKSTLYKEYIKPILGRNIEAEDFDEDGEIDLDALLIGKNANVTIVHKEKGENTYANIAGVGTLVKGQKPFKAKNYVRKQDREEDASFEYGENSKAATEGKM